MLNFIFLGGRILIDEEIFYSYIDSRLLYLLNQFGAKIDSRNYEAVKNDIIKNRKLVKDEIEELVIQICRGLMPTGYEKMILKYILPSIEFAQKHLLYPYNDAITTLEILSKNFKIGIFASQKILRILEDYQLAGYFDCCIFSYEGDKERGKEIFKSILNMLKKRSGKSVLVGDRLDTHIQIANTLGMISIRLTNSIFNLQEATNQNEIPNFTLYNLRELVNTSLTIKPN
jgi:putative hydrolase of the HAD superfamily